MNLRQIISKFVTQICEKNYAEANTTLDTIVTEKVKCRIDDAKSKLNGDCGCAKEKNKKFPKTKKNSKTKKVTKKVTKKG